MKAATYDRSPASITVLYIRLLIALIGQYKKRYK